MSDDQVAACLAAWRTVTQDINGLATERTPISTAVPRLLAALEAVLALTDEWDERAQPMTTDGAGMTLTSVRAGALHECANRARVAISAALLGEADHG